MNTPKLPHKKALKRLKDITPASLPSALQPGATQEPAEPQPVPRITNESVAEHREEVLGRARKFIYPLRHSRSRIVKLSITIFIAAVVAFLAFCSLELYKFQSTSAFMYGVTRVIPFPVAYADGRWVSYESYLFQVRHYMHYYQTEQGVNFATPDGRNQLKLYKQRSLDQVINRAYVDKLASQHHVSVSNAEVNAQVALARQQNRLGASDAVFRSVLNEFWGWSVGDFKSELKAELLTQKVTAAMDPATTARAQNVDKQLQSGADFAAVAAANSDDAATKANGGAYGYDISQNNRDLPPEVLQAIFSHKPGQTSGLIQAGYSIEIVKVTAVNGSSRQAAHIVFNYKPLGATTGPLKAAHPPKTYIVIN